jgi:rare lipoprotein A
VLYDLNARQSRVVVWTCALVSAVLAGCSGSSERQSRAMDPRPAGPPRLDAPRETPKPARTAGTYKIGKPYNIRGRWYVPAEDPNYDRSGVASWYGPDFHGKTTANGETYDMHGLTAAHTTLPLPSYVYVTNLANGRTILVRVNDRGPYVSGRIIDLSKGAARILGTEANGIGHVRVRYAGRAPLDGNNAAERQFLAGQAWYAQGSYAQGSYPQGATTIGGRMSLGAAK